MLNEGAVVDEAALKVIAGLEQIHGKINTEEAELLSNIRSSVRLGYPQIRPDPAKSDRIILLGGGPSLEPTFHEMRDLLWEGGAMLVTMNGSYHWAIEHNLKPNCQIVMDARAHNSRFVEPAVPGCRYVLASQCHPDTWAKVAGRPNVWIFHASAGKSGDPIKEYLDSYYNKQWWGCSGGTTVTTRAISLLRTLGFLRFDLFGVDSCWGPAGEHHAYSQPENNRDRRTRVTAVPEGDHAELEKTFWCSPWHIKQAEDFVQIIRINGQHYKIAAHGDGLIAYLIKSGAEATLREEAADSIIGRPESAIEEPALKE